MNNKMLIEKVTKEEVFISVLEDIKYLYNNIISFFTSLIFSTKKGLPKKRGFYLFHMDLEQTNIPDEYSLTTEEYNDIVKNGGFFKGVVFENLKPNMKDMRLIIKSDNFVKIIDYDYIKAFKYNYLTNFPLGKYIPQVYMQFDS